MLRKSMRKLLALIVAVIVGLLLLRWLEGQQQISRIPAGQLLAVRHSEFSPNARRGLGMVSCSIV